MELREFAETEAESDVPELPLPISGLDTEVLRVLPHAEAEIDVEAPRLESFSLFCHEWAFGEGISGEQDMPKSECEERCQFQKTRSHDRIPLATGGRRSIKEWK